MSMPSSLRRAKNADAERHLISGGNMLKRTLKLVTAALALTLGMGPVFSADPVANTAQEQVYGSQLMTRQERIEYRARLSAASTAEEKARIRSEHHERMMERAKQQGVRLPDNTPAIGGGMGPGGGAGMGAGRNR
jgi:hypothetical protein